MPAFIKHNGVYTPPRDLFVKSGGVFQRAKEGYVKHNGRWTKFWPSAGSAAPAVGEGDWDVPYYNTLTVEVAGGGGGNQYSGGGNGHQSRFNSPVPLIGDPGGHGYQQINWFPGWIAIASDHDGGPGGAYGGDTNITGGAGNGVAGPRGGGAGGLARKTWARGAANAPTPGTRIHTIVGAGGGGGAGNGWVKITWA